MTWMDFNGVNFLGMRVFSLMFILGAYLLGSISFGIVVCRAFGLPDPRTTGSGNPGATNVLRSGKKTAAAVTLLGDALKGWLAVWLALRSGLLMWEVCAVGLAVFLGHLYPVYYRFKGGKGVATALGVLLAVSVWLGVAVVLTWAIVFWAKRYSSAAALAAAALAPLYAYLLMPGYLDFVWMTFLLSTLLIWRHRNNIQKLLNGTEAGFRKKL